MKTTKSKKYKINKWNKIFLKMIQYYKSMSEYDLVDDLKDLIEDVAVINKSLETGEYYLVCSSNEESDESYRSIIGLLIWFMRDVSSYDADKKFANDVQTIKKYSKKLYDKILKDGFDVNLDSIETNNVRVNLVTPLAELMTIDGIDENYRYELVKQLIKYHVNFQKNSIWANGKFYEDYLSIYNEWTNISNLDYRIIEFFTSKNNK